MKEPLISFTQTFEQRLHSVALVEGEFLTVYVPSTESPGQKIQIEIRVTRANGPEIFCDCLPVKTFDKWGHVEE